MMVEDRLHQSQAAALLQISPSQVTRWRAKSSSFQEADNKPNSLQLHRGPAAFLEEVNEQMLRCFSLIPYQEGVSIESWLRWQVS